MREINKMKWLDEIREKEATIHQQQIDEEVGSSGFELEREAFVIGFDCATKAISNKLKETVDQCAHDADCYMYINSVFDDDSNCDCWKAKLKELGLI